MLIYILLHVVILMAVNSLAILPDSLSVDVGDLNGDGTNDVLVLEKRSVRSSSFKLLT